MLSSSVLHINTSVLPICFGGAAFVFHNAGRTFHKNNLKKISYRLFILTSLVTTLTCGFGGASIRAVKSVSDVASSIVKMHAWASMSVFLLSLVLAYCSYKAIREKGDINKTDKILLIVSAIFIIFFVLTTIVAFKIR
jgi:cytochrome bd-type quinol oxidase subunit 2